MFFDNIFLWRLWQEVSLVCPKSCHICFAKKFYLIYLNFENLLIHSFYTYIVYRMPSCAFLYRGSSGAPPCKITLVNFLVVNFGSSKHDIKWLNIAIVTDLIRTLIFSFFNKKIFHPPLTWLTWLWTSLALWNS